MANKHSKTVAQIRPNIVVDPIGFGAAELRGDGQRCEAFIPCV